jgi:threonyl-tRNA synthetase
MPNGAKIMQILQRFVEDEEERRGYLFCRTPFMAKSDLYKVSGHWQHYKDGMFVIGDELLDEDTLALRPMTCPFHFLIYKQGIKSYRDLPIRYGETAYLFRNESSGEMHGLTRMRQFTLSEGHLICRPDQVQQIFDEVLDLINYIMNALGIRDDIWYRFSKWDPQMREKYIDNPTAWEQSQAEIKKVLVRNKLKFVEADGDAAFYGPKIDIQTRNVYGKEDTLITIQLDLALADRYDMTYVDEHGQHVRPYIIHRSSIGCYERTLAMLIEKYAGAFPVWLSPTQVVVMGISNKQDNYVASVHKFLRGAGLRAELDIRNEKVGYKIREATLKKIPYMLVAGEREQAEGTISIRTRDGTDLGVMKIEEFTNIVKQQTRNFG